ncbi:UNVERIFIED_ORG: DNA-binding transcriptional LysR family regulator [Burkholderia sp. CF145]|uniref:LysR family transcriptional regulator n=1 Tax=Paraburkholderia hospita TaxID=169430 RepID=UPI000271D788|nr:LysR family transcriptional regulator [Paraburkholderia hospita]EUC19943.1 transcriptional regulator, LysR family [Burkholderia sp. BT03]SKD06437.1 DNA-binding transcriptional regulator, LysR family [Paraburkholderia hospita]
MDRLEAMAMLLCAVEKGSLSAAARNLQIPVSTLTRSVNDLEELIGTKLLVRTTRKLTLTEPGAEYVSAARRILEQVDERERHAAGEFIAPRGELVVTTPVQVARLRVLPVISQFLEFHPDIRIKLLQSDRNVDLVDARADVAVRIGRLRDSSRIATQVGSLRVVCVASPAFLKKHGTPQSPKDLHATPCVVFDSPYLSPWRFRGNSKGHTATLELVPRLLVSSPDAAADAAIESVGATMLLEHDVANAVKARQLTCILREFEVEPVPVHLVHVSRNMMALKVRRFIDFAVPKLREALSDLGQMDR